MSMSSVNDRLAQADDDSKDVGFIIGTVTDNVDPEGLGRIKVDVPNMFDSSQGDVPWIGASKHSPFGIGPEYGVYGSPKIGSKVRIELQNNDPHYGMMAADEYTADAANAKFSDPNTWGFKDPVGNELFVNMTTQDWQFTSSSGVKVFIDQTGNYNITVPGDNNVTVTGNYTATAATFTFNGSSTFNGDMQVNGGITASGDVVGGGISLDSHIHPVLGSETGTPE